MVYSLLRFKFYFLLYPLELSMANTKERNASVGDSIAKAKSGLGKGGQNRISGFDVASYYNWLDEKNPTMLVPVQYPYCSF